MKLIGFQQPDWLCVMMEFVVGTISLSCELRSLSKAAFVHVKPAQLCTENGISIRSEERRVGKECRSRWSPYH